jgi:hypothetical protein
MSRERSNDCLLAVTSNKPLTQLLIGIFASPDST